MNLGQNMAGKNEKISISKDKMTKIYSEFSEKVTRYVRGKVFNQGEVDDLVSQVFIKVFTKIDTYDESKASMSTWIYMITANTVTDYIRRNSKFSVVLPEEQNGEKVHDALITEDDYEHIFADATLEVLADALKTLDERERDLIVLRYYKNERLKTIAQMMKMSYSNTKIIHKKALKKLESYMKMKLS